MSPRDELEPLPEYEPTATDHDGPDPITGVNSPGWHITGDLTRSQLGSGL